MFFSSGVADVIANKRHVMSWSNPINPIAVSPFEVEADSILARRTEELDPARNFRYLVQHIPCGTRACDKGWNSVYIQLIILFGSKGSLISYFTPQCNLGL